MSDLSYTKIPSELRRPTEKEYQGDYRMEFRDSGNIDAFGRLRVSLPATQWGYNNQYGIDSVMTESWFTGTGSVSHDPNSSSAVMSTGGTASGAKCSRQTRQYFRYVPGKSFLVYQSGVFGSPVANVRRRRGLFDDQNGCFLEQTFDGLYVVVRSFTSGVAVDTRVVQKDWNIDAMDGNGYSGITLDMSKSQILTIDLEWLGAGRVRFGFVIDGHIYYVHEFKHANVLPNAYMTTANLPLRAEIENTGATATANTLKLICATVIIEGDGDSGGFFDNAVSTGITPAAVTTRRAVLSIRPKATLNSITNRGLIALINTMVLATGNNAFVEVIYNATIGGSPVWNSAGANSIVEYDVAGTTITGGFPIAAGYAVSGQGQSSNTISSQLSTRYPITLDHNGVNPAPVSIVCTSMSGTSNISASINFKEYI